MVISLTTTPMMCALSLRLAPAAKRNPRRSLFQLAQDGYARSLSTALDHSFLVLCTLIAAIALNVWLIRQIPKDFFPLQDTGRINATLVADQSVSFQLLSKKLTQMMSLVEEDPAVEDVVGATGSGSGAPRPENMSWAPPEASARGPIDRVHYTIASHA
jgi:multidrug efflux pump subunit AcrB